MGGSKLCPVCRKKPPNGKDGLFCSPRCQDVDLGRWLIGSYAIAGEDGEALLPANDHGQDDPDL